LQCTLFVFIRTLVTWLKLTLLLKIECLDVDIYMKTECLQTKRDTSLFEWVRKGSSCCFKSLIFTRVGRGAWGLHYKRYKGIRSK